ncbi:hypothetical protein BC830DRAFT_724542 [Chytriomyces sp. MP71]|nr:hypothetical protein BC830DRAFT_724542 [Chytriomyces sp. MP71]
MKCDLQVICSRCFSAGASCIYTARRGACESSPHSPSTSASETPSLLERVLEASDTSSGVDPKSPSISCYSLIDADLAPTLDDYMIVATMFDTITHFEPLQMLGPRAFLDRFFMQPPHLRLSLVALALYFRAESEAIPSHVLLTSYKRARKSIMRYMDIMSLQTMQAFYFLSRVANRELRRSFWVIG